MQPAKTAVAFPALTRHETISTEWKKQVKDQAF